MNLLRVFKYYGYFRNHLYFYYLYPYNRLLKVLGRKRLVQAEIFFEPCCNFRCWHCSSYNYLNKKEMSLSINKIEQILKQLKSVGVLAVAYVGGEPTLRKDLEDIIKMTTSYKIIPTIITNGSLLNKYRIDSLYKAGLFNIGFSLQSINPEIHDKLVNYKDAHAKIMEAMEYCHKKKYTYSICVVPTNENLKNGDFEKTVNYAKKRNIRINANLLTPIGKLLEDKDGMLTKDSLDKLSSFYFPLDNFLPDFKQSFTPWKVHCPMGENNIYIFPDGEVCPCTFTHISFGNILREPINDILTRMERSPVLKNIKRDQCPIAMDKEFINKVNTAIQQSNHYPPRWDKNAF